MNVHMQHIYGPWKWRTLKLVPSTWHINKLRLISSKFMAVEDPKQISNVAYKPHALSLHPRHGNNTFDNWE